VTTHPTPPALQPPPASSARAEDRERGELLPKFLTLAVVVLPFAGLLAAVALLWGQGLSWVELGLLLGMYLLTALGITVGFHRLFTHRSFEAGGVTRFVLAALGSMAAQGPLLKWVAVHRRHHRHSDRPDDPHSPHGRGLWHAHVGWLFRPEPADLDRYAGDLRRDTPVRVASALFPLWLVVGLMLPAVLGGLLTGTWAGVLLGLLWGGLARIFLVHHVTWSDPAAPFRGRPAGVGVRLGPVRAARAGCGPAERHGGAPLDPLQLYPPAGL
jgi:stearoyl-CoA desaturase (Delta-9 desaturase)